MANNNSSDKHRNKKAKIIRFSDDMYQEVNDAAKKHNISSSYLVLSGTRMALNELKKKEPNLPLPQ